ncbi:MAG: hypothetical protein JOZ57_09755, partial [Abitibacteriaceae bacterium]|nr:hypothetical protein [Abditibacteriaceae bacterium]
MSNASANRKKMFDVIGQEPLMWLEQAQELKLCADMMWQELQSIAHVSQVLAGIRVKKLALFNGYMLLTGFAFENVIKGLIVAQGISTATGAL